MSTLGNIIWFICGGILMGLIWFLCGIIMIVTVVGIPWARACFVIGKLSFCPFGREIIKRNDLTGRGDIGTGAAGMVGNVIWLCLFGWLLALLHVLHACIFGASIIGIPFAVQHLKLAGISLAPIGKTVVRKHLAEAARLSEAQSQLDRIRTQNP